MSKNLKLKIKNTQLAEALNINKLKAAVKKNPSSEELEKTAKETDVKETKAKVSKKVEKKPEELPEKEEKKGIISRKGPRKKEEAPPLEEEAAAESIEVKKTEEAEPAKAPVETKTAAKAVPGENETPKVSAVKKTAKELAEEEEKRKEGEKAGLFRRTLTKEFRDVKAARKPDSRAFDSRARHGLAEVEEGSWKHRKSRPKFKKSFFPEEIIRPKELKVKLPVTVKDLAQAMKLKASELISKLFMQGVALTLNDYLDDETTIQLLGHEFGCEIIIDTSEAERLRITDKTIQEEIKQTPNEKLEGRAPVIAFMGHVDHGKTSLIDAIRKSDLASEEAGAITQHIGAFKCHTERGEITILDTPGHEAFAEMRERGATVTDFVILVIAGDEGMKPQTDEALEKARAANVPILVAINKSDKPGFNPETVYRQLADRNLLPEAWGGEIITVNCSALNGEGIKELLEMILLQAEILELKASPLSRARGTILESELHKGLGITATLLVQNGTLRHGDALVIGQVYGRVKTMTDEHSKGIQEATPSTPIKITGLSGLPEAGMEFIVVENEKEAKKLSEERSEGRERELLMQSRRGGLEGLLKKQIERQEKKLFNVILKADVQGSLEALRNSLKKIPSDKVDLNIISAGVGEISESDIELASISEATVLGFHTKVESHVEPLIREKKVPVILHDVIYHLVDDVKAAMTKLLDKIREEKEEATILVQALFKSSQLGNIAGCIVQEGTVHRNHHVKLFRKEEKIWEGEIQSLKRVKDDVREVAKGLECGIVLSHFDDLKVGDIIKSYKVVYTEHTL